jgi:hypothetical protein
MAEMLAMKIKGSIKFEVLAPAPLQGVTREEAQAEISGKQKEPIHDAVLGDLRKQFGAQGINVEDIDFDIEVVEV